MKTATAIMLINVSLIIMVGILCYERKDLWPGFLLIFTAEGKQED